MIVDPSVVLIFGGCCSNVFALEAIVQHEPDSGILITVTQLFLTALVALPSQLERVPQQTNPSSATVSKSRQHDSISSRLVPYRFREPQIPFLHLAFMALMFCAVNLLNNWAFAFAISVPMHIILRSFGSVTTLTMGWLWGKRYSRLQVLSVIGLTIGVLVSAWADASAKGAKMELTPSSNGDAAASSYVTGLGVLFVAQVLAALQGIYTEQTYATYGRHWQENLFYTHFLGAIFSIAFFPTLRKQLLRLLDGPKFSISTTLLSAITPYLPKLPSQIRSALHSLELPKYPVFALLQQLAPWSAAPPSKSFMLLLLNAATQVLCISGVNRLAATTTAVTVTVVLNVRKLASFLLSCLLFGNKLSGMMIVGATIVFGSGGVYGWDSSRRRGGGDRGKTSKDKGEEVKGEEKTADSGAMNGATQKDKGNGTVTEGGGRHNGHVNDTSSGMETRSARERRG